MMKSFRLLPLLALAALAPLTLSPAAQAEMVYRRGTGATPDTLDPTKSETQPAARIIYD
ncbi:MAG: peptide ABC transporter substrate-binding protein, partial [Niveispirillum sp.]|nr:peptide ABC transporter substrate-binding protein [Niveispirillum sp.]